MKLNIKLENSKYCDNCPCSYVEFDEKKRPILIICGYSEHYLPKWIRKKLVRPQRCIRENGK